MAKPAKSRAGKAKAAGRGLPGLALRISPHGRITAVSMMKDEGPYVLEWVAHHLAVGFTDLVVYTNDCSDGTDEMLMRLEELGLAHHRVNKIPEGQRPQPSALNYAQEEPLVGSSDWVLVFDADEFLCIKYGDGTLDDLIAAAETQGANGIVITWRIFGSGGVEDWSRAPVTEQYLLAAPPSWNKGWGVKTLFRFDPDYWKLGIHRPKLKSKWLKTEFPHQVKWLNGSGLPMPEYFTFRGWRSVVKTVGYDWAQMNHYAVKSKDSYAIRKFRGNVNFKADKYNADYWALQDRNEVRDDTMLRYSEERSRIFNILLDDPHLNRLHHAALDRAEARLAEFKGTPAHAALVEGLRAASAVPIGEVDAKPPQPRDRAKIAALMSDLEKQGAARRIEERQKPPQDREIEPLGLYVRGGPEMAAPPALDWYPNHDLHLPADLRLFAPPALLLIREGKFERNLARNMPKLLPKNASILELGTGCGFVAAHLARVRADLTVTVAEASEARRELVARIWTRNGLPGPNLRLEPGPDSADGAALAACLGRVAPKILILGAAALDPAALALALVPERARDLAQVYLTGPLLAESPAAVAALAAFFADLGLAGRLPLDPTIVLAFQRGGA